MIPNISLLGHNVAAQDFWAAIVLLGAIAGITIACAFARKGNWALDVITTIVWGGVFISVIAVAAKVITK